MALTNVWALAIWRGRDPRRCQGRGVREIEIVRAGGAKPQIKSGVVEKSQSTLGQLDLALQGAGGGHRSNYRFENARGGIAGGGQARPGVALVVGHPRQSGEPRPRRGQIGRALTVVNQQAEGPATRSEPADDVGVYLAVYSRCDRPCCKHSDITAFHAPVVSCT